MSVYTKMVRTLRSREGSVVFSMAIMAASASLFAVLTSRWLGPSDRGIIVVSATTSSLLMLVGSLGVGTGGRVLLGRQPGLPIRDYLATVVRLGSLHLATVAVLGIGMLWVTKSLDDPVTAVLFLPYAVLMLLAYLMREGLHGLGLHTSAIRGDIATTSIQTAVVLIAAPLDVISLRIVLFSMVVGQFVQVLMHLQTLSGSLTKRSLRQHEVLESRTPRSIVRFSVSALPVIFGQAFVIRGDRLVLGVMSASATVGIYGAAATFTELLWLIASGVAQVAFKRSSQTSDGGSSERQRRHALALTAAGCVVLSVSAPALVPLLLGEAFRKAVPLVFVLSAAALPMASYQIDVAVLNGLGLMRRAGITTAAGSVTLGALCVLLIPHFGAMGAAIASAISYSVLAVMARVELRHRRAR